nr:hypothetical protein [Tanacetum cinerariifolium]
MGIPPRQSSAKKSTRSKVNLARNGAIANVEYIFHLLEPPSQTNDSFSTLEIKGLLLCASYSAKASTTHWAISALMMVSVIGVVVVFFGVSDFATPVIKSTITESLKDVVQAKSSSQPQSTYEAATSLTEFKLKKIMIEEMEKSREDKDKDEDPPAGSDQGMKRQKTSKDVKSTKGSKSKESKSTSSSKVTTCSQPKSSGKSAQAEEPRMLQSMTGSRNWVNTYAIRNTKLLSDIEDNHHGLSDALHNPP